MNSETGDIAHFKSKLEAEAAGYDILLSDMDAETLLPMNRKSRRKWAAEQRKVTKQPKQRFKKR